VSFSTHTLVSCPQHTTR